MKRLAGSKPLRILYIADAQDLAERAEHLQQVLGAVLDYVGAIVVDTSYVASGGSIDRRYLLGSISDVACDVAGSRFWQALGPPMDGRRKYLLSRLLVDPLAEPDAGAASVLIDELDAARIQRLVNLSYCIASSAQFPIRRLKSSDRWF
jgi:hypothetical protein